MKVIHITTIDCGGAYKATVRISESMRKCGVTSEVILRTKQYGNTVGTEIFTNIVQKLISKAKNLINLILSAEDIDTTFIGTDISGNPLVKDADVIILHWVNSFISYKNVEQLIRMGKPIIWVMHDMWLFTGGCHIDRYCGGYVHDCGKCPYLNKKKENDLSRKNFFRKVNMMDKGQIVLVGPSRWIVDCAKESRITQGKKIIRIPNPINETIFYKRENRNDLRKKYHLPIDKKIILFGAMRADGDKNKGMQYLDEALQGVSENEYMVVVFGNKRAVKLANHKLEIVCLGMIEEEEKLAEIYNCADVFVAPSLQEAFGYTVCEALACGVPVAAFAVGGILDQIRHKENGYLARKEDAKELLNGIKWCAEMDKNMICQKIEETNGYNIIGEQYKHLLQNMCRNKLG